MNEANYEEVIKPEEPSAEPKPVAEVIKDLRDLKLVAELVVWKAYGPYQHKFVVEALKDANLDASVAKEFQPRQAFTRACRKLEEQKVIDVVKDDRVASEITFQLTGKSLKNDISGSKEMVYNKETYLVLNTNTGKVICPIPDLEKQAQVALDLAMDQRTTSDVTGMIQKLFDQYALQNPGGDLIPARDQGGVYLVLEKHFGFTDKIDLFLSKLGGKVQRWPIPAGTQHGDRAIQDTVADAMKELIYRHELAVDGLTIHARQGTIEEAQKKIDSTRNKLEAYAFYLTDRKEELLWAIDQANQKLLDKVEEIKDERKNAPVESGEGKDEFGSRLGSQAAIINAALTTASGPKTIDDVVKETKLGSGRVKDHLKFLVGKSYVKAVAGGYQLLKNLPEVTTISIEQEEKEVEKESELEPTLQS